MGIAGLVLGIIALVLGWIPIVSVLAIIMALVGLILSIVDTVKKSKTNDPKRGTSIAGIIISAIAFVISGIMSFFLIIGIFIGISAGLNSQEFRDAIDRIEDGYYEFDIQDNYDLNHYLDEFEHKYDYDFNL